MDTLQIDEIILSELRDLYKELQAKGRLLSKSQLEKQYNNFRQRFDPERLKSLDGEELLNTMHNLSNKDSLVYWLEFKDDEDFSIQFGSIAGGSALKFGVYWRKETGAWTTGSSINQIELTTDEAVEIVGGYRDQLVKGSEYLSKFPLNATDEDYVSLQKFMDEEIKEVSDTAWGHKYFSILFPNILDDFHNPDFQRFHLIKLLIMPPEGDGRYIAAGPYIRLTKELDMPLNHLTSILNDRNGKPYKYWRIGTSDGNVPRNRWAEMKEGSFAAIGWEELGDLSHFGKNKESRTAIKQLMCEKFYPDNPSLAGRKGNEVYNFLTLPVETRLLMADGATIVGIGKLTGEYYFEPETNFPHRRPVEWISLEEWLLPMQEGLQTTVAQVKKHVENLIEAERYILKGPKVDIEVGKPDTKLTGISERVRSILNRKGQVILYGPPGTGKTYWAERSANDIIAIKKFGKLFNYLIDSEKAEIIGDGHSFGQVRLCCFHPAYGYEDFLEGYRPEEKDGEMAFAIRNGIFKTLCEEALENSSQEYILIIDEINRGDIPRIFGELITVLEKNKRGKKIVLPLTRTPFEVPPNVFIIGTMNTADRSISLLDAALRRRFGFIELMPDSSVLGTEVVNGIPLGPWLDALNKRIRDNIGRDARNLQIGHSYLMVNGKPIDNFRFFVQVFQEDIVPLLEEYCYEDYDVLENILGKALVDSGKQIIRQDLFTPTREDELVQALTVPCPEIFSTTEAIIGSGEDLQEEGANDAEDTSDEVEE